MDNNLPPYSEFARVVGVFCRRKVALFGFFIIVLIVFAAIFAPFISPYDPYEPSFKESMQHPSVRHLLGTDQLGRDTFSRIIYGSRTSLYIGISAVLIGSIIGQSLGLIAAYFGGKVNALIMRSIDAVMCIPPILNAMIIAAVLGGGSRNLILALSVAVIPVQTRLMCGQALTIKENDYILAARTKGAGNIRVMLRHILPNAFPPLMVAITIDLGMVILAESGLSFLGVGITPPTAAWGSMVSEGYKFLFTNPMLSFAPGFIIVLTVFAFNMTGDGLRDALDPRLRGAT